MRYQIRVEACLMGCHQVALGEGDFRIIRSGQARTGQQALQLVRVWAEELGIQEPVSQTLGANAVQAIQKCHAERAHWRLYGPHAHAYR